MTGGGNLPMNTYYIGNFPVTDELYHYGTLGQKWGVRRYQNPDGSLTDAGFKRYYGHPRKIQRDLNRLEQEYAYAKGDEYINRASYERGNKKALKQYKKLTGKSDLYDGTADDIQKRFAESGLRNNKNWAKLVNKQNRAMAGIEAAQKEQQEIKTRSYKLMSKALEQKYSVITSPAMRNTVDLGNSWAGAAFGAIGGLAIGAITAGVYSYALGGADKLQTEAKKHKVRNDGKGEAVLKYKI